MGRMQILACQYDIAWEDKPENFRRIDHLLRHVAICPGSLIVLPEMFSTGFSFNLKAVAEEPDRAAEKYLAQLASDTESCVIGGVVTHDLSGKGLNQALAMGPDGKALSRFTKLHPFSPVGEHHHFHRGHGPEVFSWQGWRIATFVCYDLRFPEAFRLAAKQDVQLMICIANFPAKRDHHWRSLLVARAIENQCYMLGVNRVGSDPNASYCGSTLLVDPLGHIVKDAGKEPGVINIDLDQDNLCEYRKAFPVLRDRWMI
ncbi:MAG: amidohydrolase [Phycisphaeraceae bacterium]|nr:amidohydrolase [Phycisphaeraceae bacterium]